MRTECGVKKDSRVRGSGRLNSRGEGNAGCIVILLLCAAGLYVAYLFAIPSFQYNNLESRVSEMVPYFRNHNAEYIQNSVIEIARDFDLTLKPEQVKVQVLRKKNRIIIDYEYSKPVTLPFYTHTLTFHSHLTGSVY